jgi:tRNA-specific 2-thiouridylase
MALGADRIATGHYAQVRENDGLYQLLKAEDGSKDQSYFLYRLNQQQLAKTWFPLGALHKRDVREIARSEGLPNHDKKDSTGICFIGERPFREFLNRYLPANPGDIVTPEGVRVGRHMGLMFYTLGQRQGLGIGGTRGGDGDAWYVAGKDMKKNRLMVVQGHDHALLFADQLTAVNLSWISGESPHSNWVYSAKTRYRQKDAACSLSVVTPENCVVEFAENQWAATPGQSLVVYESRVCIGGGIIQSARQAQQASQDAGCPPDSEPYTGA